MKATNASITIDTPEGIAMYRLIAMKHALKLEIQTGMRMRGNGWFNAAKQLTGKKTRKACLEAVEKIIEEAKTA
jgi:hypothetical protein